MINKFKYIIFDGPGGGDGIIFAPSLQHRGVASKMKYKVLSAGFISINHDEYYGMFVQCFGESNSLKIKSKKGDEFFFRYLIE